MTPTKSSSSSSKLPNVRKEGKSHNLKIQLNGAKAKSKQVSGVSKSKVVFPKMTIKQPKAHSPFQLVLEQDSVKSFPATAPTATIVQLSSDDEREEEEEQGSDLPVVSQPSSQPKSQKDTEDTSDEDSSDSDSDEDTEEEDEEDDGEGADASALPAGSIHTQYPDNFILPDPYGLNEVAVKTPKVKAAAPPSTLTIPVTAASAPPTLPSTTGMDAAAVSYASMSPAKQKAIKEILLSRLDIVVPEDQKAYCQKTYSINNTCDELQDVYNHYKAKRAIARGINDSRQMVNMTMQVLEAGMVSQKIVDLSLMQGCSQNTALMIDGGEFDDILVELTAGTFANYHPLTRLAMSIGFGLVGYYGAQKMTRQVSQKPFQHPMAAFMNPSAAAAVAQAYPMPWPKGGVPSSYPMDPSGFASHPPPPAASAAPHFATSMHPPPPQQQHHHHHHNMDSHAEMQNRIHAQEAARMEQSRASMLQAESPLKRKRKTPSPSSSTPPPLVVNNNNSFAQDAAKRFTADQMESYHHGGGAADNEGGHVKKQKKNSSSSSSSEYTGSETEEDSEVSEGGSDSDEEEDAVVAEKQEKKQVDVGKTKTAIMLNSSSLQAKIDKAIAMNKNNLTANGFTPLRRQTEQGPPSPIHPRAGNNLPMAPPSQSVSSLLAISK